MTGDVPVFVAAIDWPGPEWVELVSTLPVSVTVTVRVDHAQ